MTSEENVRSKRRAESAIKVIFAALIVGASACATTSKVTDQQIVAAVERARSETDPKVRADAALEVAELVRDANPRDIEGSTIEQIISLLDSPHDTVRMWAATSLGRFGKRAKAAVPKLLELLPAADCQRVGINSATAIRGTLPKLGVTAPKLNCSAWTEYLP